MSKDKDFEASLSDDQTFSGKFDGVEAQSLGDQTTFTGGFAQWDTQSLGDQATLGGISGSDEDLTASDMEVVDLETRYKVEGLLGKGGMGEVLLAIDMRLNRKVTIKRMLGSNARSKAAVNRFLTEAQSIAALNHPNIVQIYDYGRAKDGPFLIMEYVEGNTLLDRCRDGALPLEEAIEITCQLCDGLTKAHSAGIIHRDIKPANVLMTADGVPKLTDFGLAKADAADTGMTVAGAVLGTLDFMPPEQRRDAALVDARSDLWSLAATLYQMVTGESPKVIRLKRVPLELVDVLDKALEDSKEARYQSAREFMIALRQLRVPSVQLSPNVVSELFAGECPACHTGNESHRKFCRECGESLRCQCMQCEHEIPVWDKICPECGGKQAELAAARIKEIQAQRQKAEQQREAYNYQSAIDIAHGIAAIDDRRLNQEQPWAIEFIESTKTEWQRQQELASQHFTEAKKHRDAFDYDSAIHAIESIPEPLRAAQVKEYFRTLEAEQRESVALIDTIKSRISERAIDGLLPLVEKALSLRGDRDDLRKLLQQLRERELKLNRERDEAFVLAKKLLGEGKAKEAYQLVKTIDTMRLVGDQPKVLTKLEPLFDAEREIAAMVKEAKADGVIEPHETLAIFPKVNDYLRKNPKHMMISKLRDELEKLLEKVPAAELLKLRSNEVTALPQSIQNKIPITNSIGMKLNFIPAGKFTMGSNGGNRGNSPAHPVTLTKPYYLGTYPVTQEEYQRVMSKNPSNFKGARNPVENVSWEDATEFCRRLSELPEERAAGRVYRLPTEAEWEYACRAGTTTAYGFGDNPAGLSQYAWYKDNSGGRTHPVGQKQPNAWGLYDMHGNVWEWCSDWYRDYPEIAVTDPVGSNKGSYRVYRGGGWDNEAARCGSSDRYWNSPATRNLFHGFRVALNFPGIPKAAES